MSKSRVPNFKAKGNAAFERFVGISLSAGKSERTCVSLLDYYPSEKRLFLSFLLDKIQTEEFISADSKLLEALQQDGPPAQSIFFDCPVAFPRCLESEEEGVAEIAWMEAQFVNAPKKRPRKNFTPYTQRGTDLYFANVMRGIFEVHHALGANLAPVTARAKFLRKGLTRPVFETNTKVAVWRLGQELGLRRSHLKNHRSAVSGQSTRREFLRAFVTRQQIFIYEQDLRTLIDQAAPFDSLIAAFVGFLHDRNLTEQAPADFPAKAAWIFAPQPEGVLAHIDRK